MEFSKKITNLGCSSGLIIDKFMTLVSGIKTGDMVNIKCSKGKIIITKKED